MRVQSLGLFRENDWRLRIKGNWLTWNLTVKMMYVLRMRVYYSFMMPVVHVFRDNHKRYSLESRLHFRIHAANIKLKQLTESSQSSLN